MFNLNCLSCGFLIEVDEHTESCVCEACNNTWSVVQLAEYKQRVKEVLEKVTADFERIDRQAEEERERKRAEEERKKRTEEYIARREADAKVEAAKSAGKPQTVIVNGPNVQEYLDNAVSSFVAKDFNAAVNAANDVLSGDAQNIPAGFIVAFNEHVFKKRMNYLDKFFDDSLKLPGRIPGEDMQRLCQLFSAGRLKLGDYEAQILEIVYANSAELGAAAVCKFVDGFSPNIIAARNEGGFLSGGLADVYKKLAAFCSIPQTCFALLKAIETNPDSPLKNGQYFLKVKNKRFYDELVIPVGEIIDAMRSEKNRPQFQKAFADKSQSYRQKTGI